VRIWFSGPDDLMRDRNQRAGATVYGKLLVVFLIFVGAGAGVFVSQYMPIFGGVLEKKLAQPWSEARIGLIGEHVLVLAGVGAALGFLLLWLRGSASEAPEVGTSTDVSTEQPSVASAGTRSTARRLGPLVAALVALIALAGYLMLGPATTPTSLPVAPSVTASAAPAEDEATRRMHADMEARAALSPYVRLVERGVNGDETSTGLASILAATSVAGFVPEVEQGYNQANVFPEAAEVGTGMFDDRRMPAGIVQVEFWTISRGAGRRKRLCVAQLVLHDEQFSMWRDLQAVDCDDSDLAARVDRWRKKHDFVATVVWPGPPKHGVSVAPPHPDCTPGSGIVDCVPKP